jgi:uncharacterized membrane protein
MKTPHRALKYGILIIIYLLFSSIRPAATHALAKNDQPIVRAVLFYSPACGHCHIVIQQTLPPLLEQYGEQFQIIGVDTSQPQGQALMNAARDMFNLEFAGVPFLVIGNEFLFGSVDIPEKLPGLIEKYLSQGGVDWPDIPGLRDAIHAVETAQAPTPTSIPPTPLAASLPTLTPAPVIPEADTPSDYTFALPDEVKMAAWERVMLDPIGNGIAIGVLLVMIAVLGGTILIYRNIPADSTPAPLQVIIPLLCILGLGIAGYLAYVETTHTSAVCGPVGDCNAVQLSEYARLFGILPIGVLGVLGYLAILFSWAVVKTQTEQTANYARMIIFVLSTIGLLFSIYLTFLEPFVIGATCAWCITSAIIMTLLFALTLRDGKSAFQDIFLKKSISPKV